MLFFGGYRPRLRFTLLILIVGAAILSVVGLWMTDSYQNNLVRQTERMLTITGNQIASTYQLIYSQQFQHSAPQNYGSPFSELWREQISSTRWRLPVRLLDINFKKDPIYSEIVEYSQDAADPVVAVIVTLIQQTLRDAATEVSACITISDVNGTVILPAFPTACRIAYSVKNLPEFRTAVDKGLQHAVLRNKSHLDKRPVWGLSAFGKIPRVHSAVPIIADTNRVIAVVLLSKTPPRVFEGPKEYKRLKYPIAILLLLVLFSLVTSWFVTKPISRLSRHIQDARSQGKPVPRLVMPVTWEMDDLSREVTEATEELQRRSDYIRDFAGHVSHEFKNPLGAIQFTVTMLRSELGKLPPSEIDHFLSNIQNDAERLLSLTSQLSEYTKAEVLEVGATDQSNLGEVLQAIQDRYQDATVTINADSASSKATVNISAETLESILTSLIDNAYTHGGKNITVETTYDLYGNQQIIRIRNDGESISNANAERIFEPFFTTKRDAGNTGLGLPIVKALLAAHDGEIRFVPTPDGVTFELKIHRDPIQKHSRLRSQQADLFSQPTPQDGPSVTTVNVDHEHPPRFYLVDRWLNQTYRAFGWKYPVGGLIIFICVTWWLWSLWAI